MSKKDFNVLKYRFFKPKIKKYWKKSLLDRKKNSFYTKHRRDWRKS